jgi:uncharacterized protein YprB with RNaseH-like and TPR domain
MDNELKVLVFDIETAPMLAYIWDLRDERISLDRLKQDSHILAWAAKWLGAPASKVIYRDQRNAKDIENDRAILGELWRLLDEADIVVTQNGQNFDAPRLNARFMIHGMPPPSPYKHIDTYQIAKRAGGFTSNKLEYLTGKLCKKYKKLSHKKFPGFSLWRECLGGNKKAWEEMRRYNIHDVLSTEELYTKLRAWAPENANKAYLGADCATCGAMGRIAKRGFLRTKSALYQRRQCQGCGVWDKEKVK